MGIDLVIDLTDADTNHCSGKKCSSDSTIKSVCPSEKNCEKYDLCFLNEA